MKTSNNKSTPRILVLISACVIGGAAAVSGCGWDYYTDHSVRFNGYRNASEFSRLPRLATFSRLRPNKLFSWGEDVGSEEDIYERHNLNDKKIDECWQAAIDAAVTGDLHTAHEEYERFLDQTRPMLDVRWGAIKDLQKRRNTAFDILDALTALEQGTPAYLIQSYCSARLTFHDRPTATDDIDRKLAPCRNDKSLKDNAAYLEAAVFFQTGKSIGTNSFAEVAVRFPRSEKREAALFMSGVSHMKAAESRTITTDADPNSVRDNDCELARREFQRMIREYPKGRYVLDAKGWLAHLWVIVGDRPRALADYYRMLGSDDELWRAEAVVSIGTLRHQMDESEMAKLENLVTDEPRTAIAYAYHEIYNYADAYKFSSYVYRDRSDDAEALLSKKRLSRIATFATRMMSRYPSGQVGGGFVLRVAEAQLELENHPDAARLARRALAMGVTGDLRAEALWVAGAGEYRLKQYVSAKQALETLVKENRNNRYTEGGWRLLAMLREDNGDLEGALDAYLAVDFRYDVAYFTDVLMTADQLQSYLDKRPSIEHRDELYYALGIRYLRDRRWRDAKRTLCIIKPLARNVDEDFRSDGGRYRRDDSDAVPEKLGETDPHKRGVRIQWVDQDVRTANDLERLEREAASAEGDEARAEALYQVASYQFERSLLFYNPIAWQGIRHYLLCDLDHNGGFRQPGESQKLFDYMQRHDMAANSLPIFLEVAARFPKTRAARDALYTAAVCHKRLLNYNEYWSTIYSHGGHAADRMVTFRDVRAVYPRYRFPRGTIGWEPSTRTVNGGLGWDPLPKPKPRPSKWMRAATILNNVTAEIIKLLNRLLSDFEYCVKQVWLGIVAVVNWIVQLVSWIGHWFWMLTMFGWLWFLWPRLRDSRSLMNEALSQCESRPQEEANDSITLIESNRIERYLGLDLRDKVIEAGKDLAYKLRQVGVDRRGRSIIAFYVACHYLFVMILLRVLINL